MPVALVLAALVLGGAGAALGAENHSGTVGNFYFELDAQGDRTRLVVQQGDRITFTVREYSPPFHSVTVPDLGIESGELFLLDTYTTPPLDQPGTYRMFCRPHEDRGHVAALVVEPAPRPTEPEPAPPPAPDQPPAAPTERDAPPADESGSAPDDQDPVASESGEPADDTGDPELPVRRTETELEDDLGALGFLEEPEPWTHTLRLLVLAVVPILAAAAFALYRDTQHRRVAETVALAGRIILSPAPSKPSPAKRRPAKTKAKAKTTRAKKATKPRRRST